MNTNNLLNLQKEYISIIQLYLSIDNKLDIYYKFEDFYYKNFSFNKDKELINHPVFINYQTKFKKILKKLRIAKYNQWKLSDNKEFVYKNAVGFNRKLKCYLRNFDYSNISINDPFTEDEILYLNKFFSEVYEVEKYDLSTLNSFSLYIALSNLLTN